MFRKGLVYTAAVGVAVSVIAGSAFAQDENTIRGNCITEAMKAYPETSVESQNSQARTEIYITCMRRHGLQP